MERHKLGKNNRKRHDRDFLKTKYPMKNDTSNFSRSIIEIIIMIISKGENKKNFFNYSYKAGRVGGSETYFSNGYRLKSIKKEKKQVTPSIRV